MAGEVSKLGLLLRFSVMISSSALKVKQVKVKVKVSKLGLLLRFSVMISSSAFKGFCQSAQIRRH